MLNGYCTIISTLSEKFNIKKTVVNLNLKNNFLEIQFPSPQKIVPKNIRINYYN